MTFPFQPGSITRQHFRPISESTVISGVLLIKMVAQAFERSGSREGEEKQAPTGPNMAVGHNIMCTIKKVAGVGVVVTTVTYSSFRHMKNPSLRAGQRLHNLHNNAVCVVAYNIPRSIKGRLYSATILIYRHYGQSPDHWLGHIPYRKTFTLQVYKLRY